MPKRVQEGVNSTGPSASKHTLFEAISVGATAGRFGSATASPRLPRKREQFAVAKTKLLRLASLCICGRLDTSVTQVTKDCDALRVLVI